MSANDPEIPDSCPKCGANRLPSDYSAAFACGTLVSSKGNYHHTITCHHFSEFRKPLDAERDALAARVKDLEAERNKAVARYECVRRMNATEFAHLLQDCVFKDLRFDDEIDKKVKETKP